MGFFNKIAEGIKKTKDSMMGKFDALLNSFTKIDDDFFEELEELLITCDIGVETSLDICSKLRDTVKAKGITDTNEIKDYLKSILIDMLGEDQPLNLETKPSVILIIGVNGAGKTTTIGKLASKYVSQGKKVLVAAADTFRAAAIEQLQIWTERAGADIIKHEEGSDPAAVVFDGVTAAKARGADVLICDTAGRLHNKKNLMEELKKISRIIKEKGEGCSLETLLVLDATTGQNAVNQAKLFSEVADITGIVLTKLDGTAKGGIIISIHNELHIPVKLVGVGEKTEDLQEFNAVDFVNALFETETSFDHNYECLDDTDTSAEEEYLSEGASTEKISEEITAEENISANENIPAEENMTTSEDTSESEEVSSEKETPSENSEEESDIRRGRFGWLFKEIKFGKDKKE